MKRRSAETRGWSVFEKIFFASVLLALVFACARPCVAQSGRDELPKDLTTTQLDSLVWYVEYLEAELELEKIRKAAASDSMRISLAAKDIQIAALKENQRKWYDEPLIIVKVLALAWAASELTD